MVNIQYNLKLSLSVGIVLASSACLPIFDTAPTPYYAPAYTPPQASPPTYYEPAPYRPPPFSSALPTQALPPPLTTAPAPAPQVRYVPPQPFSSPSLLTPTPAFATASSGSLLGPQRSDWKPFGGF